MLKFEKNSWGYYEIDLYNHPRHNELTEKLDMSSPAKYSIGLGVYYREYNYEWYERSSGMTFDIRYLDYYPRLKKFLDDKFNIFIRKEKLKKIESTN